MHVSLSKANGGVWQPNQIDKEYDRLKGLGAPYARPYIYIYVFHEMYISILLEYFRKHVPPFFTPNQTIRLGRGSDDRTRFCSSGLHY